jgi:hypothetical protein
MKVCSSCKVEKSKSDFQVRRESKDGLTASCKACLKIRDRNRENESRRQKRREYQKTEAGKQAHKRAMDAYHKRYPMKYVSHIITGNAIRDGKLIQANECSVCKSTEKIEGHHDDYTKPLEVRWLCESCHKEWHRHNKPIYQ